jgi:hypothetical protein
MRSLRFTTCRLLWTTAFVALAPLAAGQALHAQTAVISARPAALRVEAGGAGGEIVVEGSGLDQVRNVDVTLSGRVHTGVSGRIARASTAVLVLQVAAAADVRGTSGLRVVLVTSRQRIEIPATLDVVVPPPPPEDTVPPPAPPPEDTAPPPAPPPEDTVTTAPAPTTQAAGSFIVTVAQPAVAAAPPDPLTHTAGVFVVVVDPTVAGASPLPVTAAAGTFVVTIAPPGSGGP